MQAEQEGWRPIPGAASYYRVNASGQILNVDTGHIRKPTTTSHGYFVVSFKQSGRTVLRYVHDIVAAAFLGEKPDGMTVNHIDGVKKNNEAMNLEYVSGGDNVRHAHQTGLCNNRGESHGMSKLKSADINPIRGLCRSGNSDAAIGRRYGVQAECIRQIRLGKRWRHVPTAS